jgi:hypothetical protein
MSERTVTIPLEEYEELKKGIEELKKGHIAVKIRRYDGDDLWYYEGKDKIMSGLQKEIDYLRKQKEEYESKVYKVKNMNIFEFLKFKKQSI